MMAKAAWVAPLLWAMASRDSANLPEASLPSFMATFKPSTEPKKSVIGPMLPPVAVMTSFRTPSRPLDFKALASNSIPSFSAALAASPLGAMILLIAALMPVIAWLVPSP